MSFVRDFKRILKGNIGIIVVSWVLFGIGNVLVYPYFSIYVKLLGGGDFDIGLVNSISSVAGLLLTIPGGYLTDVYSRKRIIIFCTWIVVSFYFLYAIAPDWRFLLITKHIRFNGPLLYTSLKDNRSRLPTRRF